MRLVFAVLDSFRRNRCIHPGPASTVSVHPSDICGFASSDPGSHLGGSSRGRSMPGKLEAGRQCGGPQRAGPLPGLAPSPPAPMDWRRAGGHSGGAGSGRPTGGHGPAAPWECGGRCRLFSPAWQPGFPEIAARTPYRWNAGQLGGEGVRPVEAMAPTASVGTRPPIVAIQNGVSATLARAAHWSSVRPEDRWPMADAHPPKASKVPLPYEQTDAVRFQSTAQAD
jgi:hypothetical protein